MSIENEEINSLIEKAIEAKEHSYSPYSKFRVGCALLTNDGKTFIGCNVENASYGLTICAERTAIVKAVSEGYRKFKAIAVCTDMADTYVAPCGACRQFIAEFGLEWTIIIVKTKEEYHVCKVKDILPYAFDQSTLDLHSTTFLKVN